MAKRGRKSQAELHTATISNIKDRKPVEPSEHLTDDEKAVWRTVLSDMPYDWIKPEHEPLLSAYCRHVTAGRKVAELVEKELAKEELDVKALNRVLGMAERESRAVAMLATKLRFSHQAQKDASTAFRQRRNSSKRPSWVF